MIMSKKRTFIELFMSALIILFMVLFLSRHEAIEGNFADIDSIKVTDFVPLYTVATMFSNDQKKLYDLSYQADYEAKLVNTKAIFLPYIYPPHSILFFLPLLKFSLNDAYHIWQLFSGFCTLAIIWLLYHENICRKNFSLILATTLIVFLSVWRWSIINGQPTIIATLGIFTGYILAQNKRFLLAVIVLIISTFKPQMVIVPFLYLLIIHGKEFGKAMLLVGAVTFTICSYIFGVDIWQSYIHSLLYAPHTLHEYDAGHLKMVNVRAILLYFFGEQNFSAVNTASLIIWLLSVVASGIIGFHMRDKTKDVQDLGFSLIIVISCVFSPYLWPISIVILIISIGYLSKHCDSKVFINLLAAFLLSMIPAIYHWTIPFVYVTAQLLLIAALILKIKRMEKLCA